MILSWQTWPQRIGCMMLKQLELGEAFPVSMEEHTIITMIIILCMLEGSPIERIIIVIELMIRKLITSNHSSPNLIIDWLLIATFSFFF